MQATFQEATQLLSQGNAPLAEKRLRLILTNHPDNEEYLALLGHSLMMQQKANEAIEVFQNVVALHPTSANAFAELANAYMSKSQFKRAELAFQKSIELNPSNSDVWHFLGNLLMQRGENNKAKSCFVNAEKNDPFRPYFEQVKNALNEKNYHQAESTCRNVLAQHPHHPQALYTLATLAFQVKAYQQAVSILEKGLSYAPYHINLWELLTKNYSHLGFLEQAINAAKKIVEMEPAKTNHYLRLATELANAGCFEESLAALEQAILLSPSVANIHLQRGHVLKTLGRREECEQAYRKSILLEPINGTAYWALADLKSYRFDEDEVEQLISIFANDSVDAGQAAQVGFALAKHYEDNNEYQTAFHYYQQANHRRPAVNFDAQEYRQSCQAICASFDSSTLSKQALSNQTPATPIFIVGLTRSGSTLLEQILASHSAIEGTMELYSMPRVVKLIEDLATRKGTVYPKVMTQLTTQELALLGESYLKETEIFRTDKPYFIDKMPPNFHNVGLIHMILPNAIIIDARRHPLSSGFSNFKQHFARGYDFSYDLENIGHYYNNYLAVMDHWDKVLPEKVLCMQYENMVQDTERQVKKLLAHCSLPYEEQCLKFHENKRAVRTASSEQVRRPINRSGMAQWKNFEQYLSPLKQALGEQTLSRFAQWT
ncbi:sulfotransferase [Colwelliaceae bacterium 6471]